jgi:hypothetical protein
MSVGFSRPGQSYPFRFWGGGSSSDINSITIDGVDGEFTVSSNTLTGKSIVLVARSGIIYKSTTGTPIGRQYSFSGNTVTFGIAFNSNEDVYIQYR